MKEFFEEKTIQEKRWMASDGTVFNNRDECQKYEDTAAVALFAQLNECFINRGVFTSLLEDNGDNDYKVLVPNDEKHIKVLNQLWFLFEGKHMPETPLFSKEDINTPIVIGYRVCDTLIDWLWFHKLKKEIEIITKGEYKLVKNEEK